MTEMSKESTEELSVDSDNTMNRDVLSVPHEGQVKELATSPDTLWQKSAMCSADLAQLCFYDEVAKTPTIDFVVRAELIPASSASSICTRESDTFSDVEGHTKSVSSPKFYRASSDRFNAKVSLQTTSRQGRLSQRWMTDADKQESVRLVTGCVPILKGGKVLLVSSNRKPEWILPKGGWEIDEALEESAIRETFEEAGVLGILGPRLADIQYETRKAKKRRLEQEEMIKKMLKAEAEAEEGETKTSSEVHHFPPTEAIIASLPAAEYVCPPSASKGDLTLIRGISASNKPSDETASNASTLSSVYSQVRMSLFPLYVSKICEEWPESSRLRKAVDIDQAIEMLHSRPEFKQALLEVKERGLHLLSYDHETQQP